MHLAGRTAKWLNMPHQATVTDKRIVIHAEPGTDLWQNTYYNFTKNTGHGLLAEADEECTFTVKATRDGSSLYDQCGILVYLDEKNWAKVCMEYGSETNQTLGSVVTTGGYSDWATLDIPGDVRVMYYRVSRLKDSFLFENSYDGKQYEQMRIFHLRCKNAAVRIGVFACSPTGDGMKAVFEEAAFTPPAWKPYKGE